jgi:hypothetical protein
MHDKLRFTPPGGTGVLGIALLGLALAGATLAESAFAQQPVPTRQPVAHRGMSGAPRLSPTVFATWYTSRDTADARLDLVVLWRGEPEWHNGDTDVGGSENMCPDSEDRCLGLVHGQFRIGDIEFELLYDRPTRTARILGEELALGDANVVLVDRIDGVGGFPTIVGVLTVPVELSSLMLDAGALVQSDERLREFVR